MCPTVRHSTLERSILEFCSILRTFCCCFFFTRDKNLHVKDCIYVSLPPTYPNLVEHGVVQAEVIGSLSPAENSAALVAFLYIRT